MEIACPIPLDEYPVVTLAHGGGGRLTQQLVDRMFAATFAGVPAAERHDAHTWEVRDGRLAFTTDGFVVQPPVFPGGDIGRLAVIGTCNDLAMAGARPERLGLAFLIEEGFAMASLWDACRSIAAAADEVGVRVVTGDTKVVERGSGDGVYITTSGVGRVGFAEAPRPGRIAAGDLVLLTGDVGRHGTAVMAAREGLEIETPVASDLAHLWPAVDALAAAGIEPACMRDATRGGLATVLAELADQACAGIEIDEGAVPVEAAVRGVCEVLGFDPFYVANEGCAVVIVRPDAADRALAALRRSRVAARAAVIGSVTAGPPGRVTCRGPIGGRRVLRKLSGEQLPRIC